MSTKREELIAIGLEKGKKVEFDDVIEGDRISLDKESGIANAELHNTKKTIKSLLRNPDFSLGGELITLYTNKKSIEKRIEIIREIKEVYLTKLS